MRARIYIKTRPRLPAILFVERIGCAASATSEIRQKFEIFRSCGDINVDVKLALHAGAQKQCGMRGQWTFCQHRVSSKKLMTFGKGIGNDISRTMIAHCLCAAWDLRIYMSIGVIVTLLLTYVRVDRSKRRPPAVASN